VPERKIPPPRPLRQAPEFPEEKKLKNGAKKMKKSSVYIRIIFVVTLTAFLGSCASTPKPAEFKDTTPPYVTLSVPYDGSQSVPLFRKIRVSFSEPIDVKTINSRTFEVFQGGSLALVSGTVVATTSTSATFTQSVYLIPNTTYVCKISNGVKDLAGNSLADNFYWGFKTEPEPDIITKTKVIVIDKLVMLEDTHFKFDDATLTEEGRSALDTNIQILKDNPYLKVRIAGYTSAAGTEEYNQELSERRANAVRAYLYIEGDVKLERLDVIGYGETRPAVYEPKPEDLKSDEAKSNMRVLFEVIVK
jgi:outer membrane protein OmpA-like peptidoglycan-associated protein